MTVHATTVAIRGRAVLIEGPSGAGKSDLALRLIDRGAMLVADDRTILTPHNGQLLASCPATIAGRIEVRGLGILPLPHLSEVPVVLIVSLGAMPPRMPEPETRMIEGIALPVVSIDARAPSAPLAVELALGQLA